jgi:hypothetical protein
VNSKKFKDNKYARRSQNLIKVGAKWEHVNLQISWKGAFQQHSLLDMLQLLLSNVAYVEFHPFVQCPFWTTYFVAKAYARFKKIKSDKEYINIEKIPVIFSLYNNAVP